MSEHSALLSKSISYDGEDYNRDNLEAMVKDYADKHETRIGELEELKKTHDTISREMTDELAEQKTVWDCVKDMASGEQGAITANMRLLLERIPIQYLKGDIFKQLWITRKPGLDIPELF